MAIGSFLNVIIYRLPLGKSIIKPKSHCPDCKTPIPLYRNIPIVSFILQKGKCNNCNSKISLQYPLVEFITALIWILGVIKLNYSDAILLFWMSSILITISIIDYYHKIIPLGLILLSLPGLMIYNIYIGDFTKSLYGLIFGLVYLGGISLLTSIVFKKETLGQGDLLLIMVLGAWLGVIQTGLTILLGSAFALFGWIMISIRNGLNRDYRLPFAPFLCFSGILLSLIRWNPFYHLF